MNSNPAISEFAIKQYQLRQLKLSMRVKNNQGLLLFNCSAFRDWLCQLLYQSYVELKTKQDLQVVICIYLHPGQLECFPFMLLWAKIHVHLSFKLCPDQPMYLQLTLSNQTPSKIGKNVCQQSCLPTRIIAKGRQ